MGRRTPSSADDTRPTRAETDADQWHRAWDDDEGHTYDMVRGVAVDSTGWGYLPGHAPIYVGLTVPDDRCIRDDFATSWGCRMRPVRQLRHRPCGWFQWDARA